VKKKTRAAKTWAARVAEWQLALARRAERKRKIRNIERARRTIAGR
jgi:hypothetical protein